MNGSVLPTSPVRGGGREQACAGETVGAPFRIDILQSFMVRQPYILSSAPSMLIIADIFAYTLSRKADVTPPISISAIHVK